MKQKEWMKRALTHQTFSAKPSAKGIKRIREALRKSIATAGKAITSSAGAMIAVIGAGGVVMVLIIIILCLAAMLSASPFGLFFAGEKEIGNRISIQSVMSELTAEYEAKLQEIEDTQTHDEVSYAGARSDWKLSKVSRNSIKRRHIKIDFVRGLVYNE